MYVSNLKGPHSMNLIVMLDVAKKGPFNYFLQNNKKYTDTTSVLMYFEYSINIFNHEKHTY